MQKYKTRSIFSTVEKEVLLEQVTEHKDVLRKTTFSTVTEKDEAWRNITASFNSRAAVSPRTEFQLRILWKNMKARAAVKMKAALMTGDPASLTHFNKVDADVFNFLFPYLASPSGVEGAVNNNGLRTTVNENSVVESSSIEETINTDENNNCEYAPYKLVECSPPRILCDGSTTPHQDTFLVPTQSMPPLQPKTVAIVTNPQSSLKTATVVISNVTSTESLSQLSETVPSRAEAVPTTHDAPPIPTTTDPILFEQIGAVANTSNGAREKVLQFVEIEHKRKMAIMEEEHALKMEVLHLKKECLLKKKRRYEMEV